MIIPITTTHDIYTATTQPYINGGIIQYAMDWETSDVY